MTRKGTASRLFEDWAAKMLSLAAAIALFSFYQLNRLEDRVLSVPLTVLTNGNLVPGSPYPKTVRLTLRGESNIVFSILERDLSAVLDLREFDEPGVRRVPIVVERMGSALDANPLEIRVDPAELALSLEQRAVRQLKILPSFRGFLEPGYELVGYSIVPQTVEASGPVSLMSNLAEAATETVELSGRSENFSVRIRLVSKDPLIEFLSAESVEFTAEIRKAMVSKSLSDLRIEPQGLQDGLRLASVLPLGNARIMASRAELEVYVPGTDALVVDLSAITEPGLHTVPVHPRFPEGISVESWLPMALTVTIVPELEIGPEQRP